MEESSEESFALVEEATEVEVVLLFLLVHLLKLVEHLLELLELLLRDGTASGLKSGGAGNSDEGGNLDEFHGRGRCNFKNLIISATTFSDYKPN